MNSHECVGAALVRVDSTSHSAWGNMSGRTEAHCDHLMKAAPDRPREKASSRNQTRVRNGATSNARGDVMTGSRNMMVRKAARCAIRPGANGASSPPSARPCADTTVSFRPPPRSRRFRPDGTSPRSQRLRDSRSKLGVVHEGSAWAERSKLSPPHGWHCSPNTMSAAFITPLPGLLLLQTIEFGGGQMRGYLSHIYVGAADPGRRDPMMTFNNLLMITLSSSSSWRGSLAPILRKILHVFVFYREANRVLFQN